MGLHPFSARGAASAEYPMESRRSPPALWLPLLSREPMTGRGASQPAPCLRFPYRLWGKTRDRFRSGERMEAPERLKLNSKPAVLSQQRGGLGERSPPVKAAEPPGVSAAISTISTISRPPYRMVEMGSVPSSFILLLPPKLRNVAQCCAHIADAQHWVHRSDSSFVISRSSVLQASLPYDGNRPKNALAPRSPAWQCDLTYY